MHATGEEAERVALSREIADDYGKETARKQQEPVKQLASEILKEKLRAGGASGGCT
jgi:hypothetical protein